MAEIKTKSVKLNMVMNALLSMSSFIFPLITFPYVSRILLPVGTGRVAFATAVVTYFAMFAQLGIPTYGIRLCAKVRDNKEELTRAVHELLFINLFMSAIVAGVVGVACIFGCENLEVAFAETATVTDATAEDATAGENGDDSTD